NVQALADAPLPARFTTARRTLVGRPALVCGTGYTGEAGVEILCVPGDAGALWDALLRRGVTPCGLAARDTLRLEVCFHLYGNELEIDVRGKIRSAVVGTKPLYRKENDG